MPKMLSSRATYEDKRSAQDASQLVQIHTLMSRYGPATCRCLLSSWYEQAHAETCKAWDTCIHMQAFNTCMYMHGFNTCRCIQSHTLDECRMIHVKHERAYMDGDWEGKYEWNTVQLLCCTWLWSKYADMQTFQACTLCVDHCIMAGFA